MKSGMATLPNQPLIPKINSTGHEFFLFLFAPHLATTPPPDAKDLFSLFRNHSNMEHIDNEFRLENMQLHSMQELRSEH